MTEGIVTRLYNLLLYPTMTAISPYNLAMKCYTKTGHKGVEKQKGKVYNKEAVKFFNEERPAYSLNYLTPKQFRDLYYSHSKSV